MAAALFPVRIRDCLRCRDFLRFRGLVRCLRRLMLRGAAVAAMVVGSVLLTGCIPVTGAPAPAYTGPVRVRSTSSATDPALTATAPGGAATDQSSGPAALLGPGPGFPTPPLLETGPAAVLVRGVRPPDKTPGTATHIRCTDSSSGWQLSLWLQFTNGWVIRTPTLMYRNRPFLTTVISGDGYWYVANPQQITAACVSR